MRVTSCGFGVSAWSIFFSAELFLRGVSVSIHTHSSLMWQWRCSFLFTSHAGRGNHALKLKSANYTAKAASNQKTRIPVMVTAMKALSHPQSPVATIQTILAPLEVQSKKWHFLFSNPLFTKNQQRMKTEVQTSVFRFDFLEVWVLWRT